MRRAHQQRRDQLAQRGVEAVRRLLQHHLARAQPPGALHPRQHVHHAAVRDHHPLGQPGGAGGVDDVRQVVGRELRVLRVRLRQAGPRARVRVERHDGDLRPGEAPGQRRLRQQDHGRAVGEHVAQPVLGIRRVQRHVRPARLEHRQQPHHHLQAALHAEPHPHVGPHAAAGQVVRQPVRPRVQLRVGERWPSNITATASGVRATWASKSSWSADAAGYAAVRARSTPPAPGRAPPSGISASRSIAPAARPPPSPPAPAAGSRAKRSTVARIEQRRGVLQLADDAVPAPRRGSASGRTWRVSRGRDSGAGDGRSPGSSRPLARRVLPGEHHLEERAVRQAARAAAPAPPPARRGCPGSAAPPAPAPCTRSSSSATVGAPERSTRTRQRVDEEADQLLHLRAGRGWRSACRSPRRPAPRAGRAPPPSRRAAS